MVPQNNPCTSNGDEVASCFCSTINTKHMKLPAMSVHHLFLRVDEAAILGAQPHIADRHSIILDEVSDPGVLYLHPVIEHSNTAL